MLSVVARAWIFVGLVVAYVAFLVTVMEFFEEPQLVPSISKVNSELPLEPSAASFIDPTQLLKSHVRVLPPQPSFSPVADGLEDLDLLSPKNHHEELLSRGDDQNDSQMNDAPHPIRLCDDMGHCALYYLAGDSGHVALSPEPMVKRSSAIVRSVFNWAWSIATKGALASSRPSKEWINTDNIGRINEVPVNLH